MSDPNAGLGDTGVQQAKFNEIQDVPVEVEDRTLQNQQISQWTQLAGSNKTIILNDGICDRVIIGFQEKGF